MRAFWVEAYTGSIEVHQREVQPLGNHMVATEPIDDATWTTIGLADRQLFESGALMLGYGHRTVDGRIAWGGLAAPSWWGSRRAAVTHAGPTHRRPAPS